ncbi:MAG: hypothetical protein QW567_01410 [Candidatus Hadarchaeales archaeon]
MPELSSLDWIVLKAAELLEDKVKDQPLTYRDVEIAFEMFASPRLKTLQEKSELPTSWEQAKDFVMMKLRERAKQLNSETWKKPELSLR